MYSAADIDALLAAVVGWMFQVQTPQTLTGADQIFRTQLPPELYASLQRSRGIMQDGGSGFTRHVANTLGYETVPGLIPAAQALITAYEQGVANPAELARGFQALACLAAVIDRQFRQRFTHAVLAESTARQLEQRLHSNLYSADRWQREWQELSRATTIPSTAEQTADIRPVTATVYDKKHRTYHIPTRLHMVDSISHHHAIEFLPPTALDTYVVDQRITIPWERIGTQILLDIGLSISQDGLPHHRVHRMWFTRQQLDGWKAKRSAIQTTIGLNGQLRLYPEYFSEAPLQLPHAPLASIRAHAKGLDIIKANSAVVLTVLV